jgi:spore coat protein H
MFGIAPTLGLLKKAFMLLNHLMDTPVSAMLRSSVVACKNRSRNMSHPVFRSWGFSLVALLVTALQVACNNTGNEDVEGGDKPEGWSEATHGPDGSPNYDVVFAQNRVGRIDVEISPENWQKMLDDMTEIHGAFGTGGNMPGGGGGPIEIPDEAFAACVDLNNGDPCTVKMGPLEIPGTCMVTPIAHEMVCVPEDILAGLPDMPDELDTRFSDQDPIWVPCTVTFEGRSWWHVGIRFKGNSTLTFGWSGGSLKLPLKFDFDEFEYQYPAVLNQRFHGFKRLALANNGLDSSYIRDKVGGDVFREGGVPAPRRAFVRIFIDLGEGPVYFGLYTMAEVPDDPMFDTQLGGTGGNLYKPDFGAANWNEGLPVNEESFPKKTNETEADWSDAERAIEALHGTREDAASWRGALEALFPQVAGRQHGHSGLGHLWQHAPQLLSVR